MQPTYSDHSRINPRSLALHRRVAKKLRADPELLEVARENLRRWQAMEGSPHAARSEWAEILGDSVGRVTQCLTDPSEHAVRLRQSSRFAYVLTEAERKAIYDSYSTRPYPPGRKPARA